MEELAPVNILDLSYFRQLLQPYFSAWEYDCLLQGTVTICEKKKEKRYIGCYKGILWRFHSGFVSSSVKWD